VDQQELVMEVVELAPIQFLIRLLQTAVELVQDFLPLVVMAVQAAAEVMRAPLVVPIKVPQVVPQVMDSMVAQELVVQHLVVVVVELVQ
jgi:hypothetical protein